MFDRAINAMYRKYVRPRWFRLSQDDPEIAHELAMAHLRRLQRRPWLCRTLQALSQVQTQHTQTHQMGLWFSHPIGLAAGFDKGCEALGALAALGFSFLEGGAVTVLPQAGNARPRMQRDEAMQTLRNRMGFNNPGMEIVRESLRDFYSKHTHTIPIGLNLGKGKDTPLEQAVEDYLKLLEYLYDFADFFTVNISSPNTIGLRYLQTEYALSPLVGAIVRRSSELAIARGLRQPKPIVVKFAPDVTNAELFVAVEVCLTAGVAGVILANTKAETFQGAGGENLPCGLSGRPIFDRALEMVGLVAKLADGESLTIIGCGGIDCADRARQMLETGADLVQLYTVMPFNGPFIARQIARELAPWMKEVKEQVEATAKIA